MQSIYTPFLLCMIVFRVIELISMILKDLVMASTMRILIYISIILIFILRQHKKRFNLELHQLLITVAIGDIIITFLFTVTIYTMYSFITVYITMSCVVIYEYREWFNTLIETRGGSVLQYFTGFALLSSTIGDTTPQSVV